MKKNKLFKSSNENVIMIKRSIEVDDELKQFIFRNSNYRRKVWNDFVAEYYICKEHGEVFDPMEFKKKYYNEVEKPNCAYDTYTTGISEQVMKDIIFGIKLCKTQHGDLHFKKFDRFRCSFKIHCKPTYRSLTDKYVTSKFNSRCYIDSDDQISFRSDKDHWMNIKLKEPLWCDATPVGDKIYYFDKNYNYAFSNEDIKTISFIHELGKFYVCFAVRIINLYSKKSENTKRKDKAGIDLGIHNPVCISDKDSNYILRMSDKELNRIHYLERRIKRLQSIMDRKTYKSKNYYKVLKKIRISYYKIRNIRLNWRRKLAKSIATRYKMICVDTYKIPNNSELNSKELSRKFNSFNRIHGMYDFSHYLIHACNKYKTKYVNSPEKTTCTCSICGHVNPQLPLSQRTFKCECCGFIIDRDANASKNCYNFILEL